MKTELFPVTRSYHGSHVTRFIGKSFGERKVGIQLSAALSSLNHLDLAPRSIAITSQIIDDYLYEIAIKNF